MFFCKDCKGVGFNFVGEVFVGDYFVGIDYYCVDFILLYYKVCYVVVYEFERNVVVVVFLS